MILSKQEWETSNQREFQWHAKVEASGKKDGSRQKQRSNSRDTSLKYFEYSSGDMYRSSNQSHFNVHRNRPQEIQQGRRINAGKNKHCASAGEVLQPRNGSTNYLTDMKQQFCAPSTRDGGRKGAVSATRSSNRSRYAQLSSSLSPSVNLDAAGDDMYVTHSRSKYNNYRSIGANRSKPPTANKRRPQVNSLPWASANNMGNPDRSVTERDYALFVRPNARAPGKQAGSRAQQSASKSGVLMPNSNYFDVFQSSTKSQFQLFTRNFSQE